MLLIRKTCYVECEKIIKQENVKKGEWVFQTDKLVELSNISKVCQHHMKQTVEILSLKITSNNCQLKMLAQCAEALS